MPSPESTPRKPAERSLSNEVQHSWDVSPQEAIAIQKKLAGLVIRENRINHVTRIAGVDVGLKEHTARLRCRTSDELDPVGPTDPGDVLQHTFLI